MRPLLVALLAAALVACGAPVAGVPTAAPIPTTPATATPAPIPTEGQAPTAPAESPTSAPATATPAPVSPAEFTLGYGQALSAAFAGDQTLVVGTTAGLLFLDAAGLGPQRFIPLELAVNEIAASPDGQFVAASGYVGPEATTSLFTAEGTLLLTVPGREPQFSRDSSLLAVAALDNASGNYTTTVYRVGDGGVISSAPGDRFSLSPGAGVVASFDITDLVLSQVGGGELFRTPAFSVAFSPDTRYVAISGFSGVELLPLADGTVDLSGRRTLTQSPGLSLAFTERGELLALTEAGILRWDSTLQGEPQTTSLELGADIGSFGADGVILALETLVGDAPSTLRLVRAEDGAEIYADAQFEGGDAFFSPDGLRAAVVTDAGLVRLVTYAEGQLLERRVVGYDKVAFGPDGSIAAGRSGPQVDFYRANGNLEALRTVGEFSFAERLRALNVGSEGATAEVEQQAFGGFIARLAAVRLTQGAQGPSVSVVTAVDGLTLELPVVWDWVGGQMVWADAEGRIMVTDGVSEPLALPPFPGVPAGAKPTSIALSLDAVRVAVGYDDGTLLLADVAAQLPLASGPLGEGRAISALAWSADGVYLAFAMAGGEVAVWEAGDDDAPRRFAAPAGQSGTPHLALSADGAVLAVGDLGGVVAYSVHDGTELAREDLLATAVTLAPDGSRIAAVVGGRIVVMEVR